MSERMEAVDDIALGALSTADLDDLADRDNSAERDYQQLNSLSGFRLSLAISLGFHFVLASAAIYLVTGSIRAPEEVAPTTLSVQFVPTNPLRVETDAILSDSTAASLPETAEVVPLTPLEAVEAPPLPEQSVSVDVEPELQDLAETEAAETVAENAATREMEAVIVPSVDFVRDAISSVRRVESSQFG